jgi:hypothetical protein
VETAILNHVQANSKWWQINRERLCFNQEDVLCYFGILACASAPETNIDLIARLLRNKNLVKSELSYELGTLIQKAFIHLDTASQDAVLDNILNAKKEKIADEHHRLRILKKQAELIAAIPCCLRSTEAQSALDDYEKTAGVLVRQPVINSMSGIIRAPFSYEVFLNLSDIEVLSLLAHYAGHAKGYDDFLVGGKREVGLELRDAASRHPLRFLKLLFNHWKDIANDFRDNIMNGVSSHLTYRFDNLKTNGNWTPIDEPDAEEVVNRIFNELEIHSKHWHHNFAASEALQACAHVIKEKENAERLVFTAIGFANLRENRAIKGNSENFITTGLNMVVGHIVEALMILANRLQELRIPFPELLSSTLRRFAGHDCPAIRALILRRLPYLQIQNPNLGWDLFERAMQDATGLWKTAERCLYYTFHNHFDRVAPLLDRIKSEGSTKKMEIWGRISALAALSNRIDFTTWLENLKTLDATDAWRGAACVWTNTKNIIQHRNQCLAGIEAGLYANGPHAATLSQEMLKIFRNDTPVISIPIKLIHQFFSVLESDGKNNHQDIFGFGKWLYLISLRDPEEAIAAIEIYLSYIKKCKPYLYDYKNNLTQLMTRLFQEAEEREESDQGKMLQRVVSIQNTLLSLGLDSINAWLKSAERP